MSLYKVPHQYMEHLIGGVEWTGGRCPTQPSEEATDEAS
jgi:hypothetical protein